MFRELTLTFFMCVFSLMSLILISRGLLLRELFLGLEFTVADIGLLFFYMVPMFLIMVIPISCMVSVFLTFLRMSTDRELIALKAGGISVYQMLRAPAVFSFACMVMTLFISLHGIAWGTAHFRSTILHIANTKAKLVVQPGVFNREIFGLTLFARQVDPDTGVLKQVIFEDTTQDEKGSFTVLAPEGEIVTDHARGMLVFHLKDGRMYRLDGENVSIMDFEEYTVSLDISSLFSEVALKDIRPKDMAWNDLVTMHRDRTAESEKYQQRVAVELQKRWSLPVACLVLGIFALPLACAFEGVKRQLGIVLALLLFLLYYSVFSVGLATGESGLVPPAVGMWAGNVLFALAAAAGLQLTYRERVPAVTNFMLHLKERLLKRKTGGQEAA